MAGFLRVKHTKKIQYNFPKVLVNLEKLASAPGSGSGLEDSDPLADRILRPKDPDPDSVGFGVLYLHRRKITMHDDPKYIPHIAVP
jgi:hypothetical protein